MNYPWKKNGAFLCGISHNSPHILIKRMLLAFIRLKIQFHNNIIVIPTLILAEIITNDIEKFLYEYWDTSTWQKVS